MVYDAASGDQKVHCRLVWSKSATDWWQWVEGPAGLTTGRDFIALGGAGEFDSHICFASKPVAMPTEERLYYMGGNGPHSGARNSSFGLATLRKDGFAGLSAWTGHGSVTLLPLVVTGASLVVTADFNPSAGAQEELGVTLGTASRLFIGVVDGPRDLSLEMAIPLTNKQRDGGARLVEVERELRGSRRHGGAAGAGAPRGHGVCAWLHVMLSCGDA